jgi:PHD/YefM family antitoxin component YafN of YafNO toxin-antitoxin module
MKATLPEPEIVTRKGKPVSVIIPIKDYEELLERLEDAGDVAWLKRAEEEVRCASSGWSPPRRVCWGPNGPTV